MKLPWIFPLVAFGAMVGPATAQPDGPWIGRRGFTRYGTVRKVGKQQERSRPGPRRRGRGHPARPEVRPRAIEWQEKSHKLSIGEEIRRKGDRRLDLYRAGKPYRLEP